MKVIVNATVITPYRLIHQGTIWIDNGVIAACGEASALPAPEGAEVIDAGGLYVAPGFVDIHVHGGGGHWAYTNPAGMARAHLNFGTTSILPTISYNETEEQVLNGVKLVLEAMEGSDSRSVAGIHMEGPYINPKYGAITSPIRPVNPAEYRQLLDIAGSHIRLWTLAPELDGQQQFMEDASQYGITLSVGHSEAAAQLILDSVRYGLRVGCHTTNACGTTPSPSRYEGTREVGVPEAIMVSDDIYAEVIPDREGRHVRPLMLKLILKAKGADQVIIITDSMDGGGLPGHPYDVNLAPKNEFTPGESEDLMLAGSFLTMDQSVRNMQLHTGAGLVDLFKMASLNPAKAVGLARDVGSIEVGKRANLIFITEDIQVRQVLLDGETVEQELVR